MWNTKEHELLDMKLCTFLITLFVVRERARDSNDGGF